MAPGFGACERVQIHTHTHARSRSPQPAHTVECFDANGRYYTPYDCTHMWYVPRLEYNLIYFTLAYIIEQTHSNNACGRHTHTHTHAGVRSPCVVRELCAKYARICAHDTEKRGRHVVNSAGYSAIYTESHESNRTSINKFERHSNLFQSRLF